MWVRKPFPTIPGYESLGNNVKAKRWLDFKINQLLDTGDPIWEIKGELKSIQDICEFVIEEFDYPLVRGVPTDAHCNNWFSGLCCHKITMDFWQLASETARTYRLNKRKGKKGVGDCEDTSILFTTLMLEKKYKAYECFGVVKRRDGRVLGGHGWAIFQDEEGVWRIFESTLDEPPEYPGGYHEIDPSDNSWLVGNIVYEAWVKFNRRTYFEWEDNEEMKEVRAIFSYMDIGRKVRESKEKYKAIEEVWGIPTTPLRKAGLLAKIRWK